MGRASTGFLKAFPLLLVLLLLSVNSQPASADRGLIGPPHVSLEEPGQIAIVAWNGQEEVLILSTNVRSSAPASVLEILPLPSNPTKVVEGSFDSFTKIAELIGKKVMATKNSYGQGPGGDRDSWGVEVTFQDRVGAHDLTIVRVSNPDHFAEWVAEFARGKSLEFSVSPKFREAVSEYLSQEVRYFVFDVIETAGTVRSINPLVYRFETDFLYYPLEITAASTSGTESSTVNLFLIAKGRANGTVLSKMNFALRSGFSRYLYLSRRELYQVSPEIGDLFEGDPLVMNVFYKGPLDGLHGDITVSEKDIHVPTLLERLSQKISERPIASHFQAMIYYLSIDLGIFPNVVITTFLVSLLAGLPAAILRVAKTSKKVAERLSLKPLGQKLLGYGLGAAVAILPLLSDVEVVVILSEVLLAFIGFTALASLTLRLVLSVSGEGEDTPKISTA